MPEDAPIPWKERGELQEVYGLFCNKVGRRRGMYGDPRR
jgi:hypothetical protein